MEQERAIQDRAAQHRELKRATEREGGDKETEKEGGGRRRSGRSSPSCPSSGSITTDRSTCRGIASPENPTFVYAAPGDRRGSRRKGKGGSVGIQHSAPGSSPRRVHGGATGRG